ncbi:glycylpeptide N-tetradecanoyltransferase 2-like isoform X2 [Saccoglossus kowalevskii]|uniref:Glycylpeptide N-tetradecanoyltransferase n=1 Tax=Saccoglossus kowalevskii TaxID=10224 RepID=A0ABM0MY26_SACKO|nr:PREDICTED: glycylpeptide N-tetradecanoyltransferase 2-like [Saccoglossus kowalevskii]
MADADENAGDGKVVEVDQDYSAIDGDNEDEGAPEATEQGGAKKKSKKKKKKKALSTEDDKDARAPNQSAQSVAKLQEIQRAIELLGIQQKAAPKTEEEAKRKNYEFWDTQPVPKIDEKIDKAINEAVEPNRDDVRQEPYSLPQGFMWDIVDIKNPVNLNELYTLLNENYVEDDDNMFRFDYSPEFLTWALLPPGSLPFWHCGVRVVSNKKLVGFISAIPAKIKVYDHVQTMVEINFLCVHKKLRSKRVAPVLIREITRRVNMQNIFQAVYTAGVVLPKPVATCKYWHRSLNPRKLIEVKFSHLSKNMTMQRTIKLYKLPEKTKLPIRQLQKKDVAQCCKLLNDYQNNFSLSPLFSEDEFEHWFCPRDDIVDAYVVESEGVITDFFSFYTLPSTIMHHTQHKKLKAGYSFYNVSTKTPLIDLMQDALILAKQKDFDVFNALDLMDNKSFLEQLKFGVGDGNLQYYLYNWRCPPMESSKVGLVLQ